VAAVISLAARPIALLASAGIHVGLVLAVGSGHATTRAAQPDTEYEIVVDAPAEQAAPKPEPEPEPVRSEAPAPRLARAEAPPTHTHPYPVPESHDQTPHDPNLVHAPLAPSAAHDHDHDHDEPTPAAAVVAAPATAPAMPTFTMTMGNAPVFRGGITASTGTATRPADTEPMSEGQVSSPAQPLYSFKPPYPDAARREGIEATVTVEIVVEVDGTVLDAHVVRRAGFGFDEAALAAVRQFRFTPARHDGRMVRERKRSTFEFRLQ
jgi:protein TonB